MFNQWGGLCVLVLVCVQSRGGFVCSYNCAGDRGFGRWVVRKSGFLDRMWTGESEIV